MQKLLGSLKLQLTALAKRSAKMTILSSLSLLHPKFAKVLIGVFQQSIGFGYDSGLNREVNQFAIELEKFKVKNPVVLDVGANIGSWSKEFNSRVQECVIHAF